MEWSWRAITGKPKEKADESRFSFTLNIASPPPHFYPNPADAIFSLFSLAPGDSREVPPVNLRLVSVARSRMRLFEPPIQKLGVFALFASQKTMPASDRIPQRVWEGNHKGNHKDSPCLFVLVCLYAPLYYSFELSHINISFKYKPFRRRAWPSFWLALF